MARAFGDICTNSVVVSLAGTECVLMEEPSLVNFLHGAVTEGQVMLGLDHAEELARQILGEVSRVRELENDLFPVDKNAPDASI